MAITIPQNDRFVTYTAAAAQTTFAYDFPIYETSDLDVYRIRAGAITQLTLTTDYTVTGAGLQAGGNVVLVVGATLNDLIIIAGDLPELRSTNYSGAGDFTKESVNTALNKLVQLDQQLRRDTDRSIHLNPADPTDVSAVSFTLPLTDDRKGKYLYFSATDGSVAVSTATGIDGPATSADKEVVLFSGTDGKTLKRPGTEYMIMPQGTTAQRGAPGNIVMRGNTDGSEDVEVYVNGGWSSVLTGGTGAPIGATYITQTPNGTLTSEQAMSTLANGLVKNTTGTGVQSIAVDGTDYISPTLQSNVDVNGNSLVSLANGDITLAPHGTGDTVITSPIVLTSQADPGHEDGKLYYDSTDHALSFYNDEADTKLQIGQENWIRVYNNSGATISNGNICYASGKENVEDRLTIALAQADDPATSKVIGAATHDIENNSFGYVTQFGYVSNVDTSAFADGAPMWLSSTAAGGYTDTEPLSPNVSVFLGYVVDSAVSGNGFITTIGNTSGTGASGDATQLVVNARKGSAGTINKGDAVYISGYNVGNDVINVEFADSSVSGTMPAIGIANSTIEPGTEGQVVVSGRIADFDTSAFAAGDELYVSETGTTGNTLTTTKPTGVALIQKVGIVNRSHVSSGVIDVIGAGRSNDIPNFTAADKYWYGAATGTAAEGDITAFGRSLIDDAAAVNARTTLGLGTGDNVSFSNGDFTGTEALKVPVGTTAQRPGAPVDGDLRVNTTASQTEIYRNAAWRNLELGAGAGSLVLLSDQTPAAAASVEFTGVIDATYNSYLLTFAGVYAGTNDSYLRLQFSTDDGVSWITTNTYRYRNERKNFYSLTTTAEESTGNSYIPITTTAGTIQISNVSTEAAAGNLWLLSPAGTNKTFVHGDTQTGIVSSSAQDVRGENTTTTAVNAIRILMDSGTIAGGNFKLYGVQ